VGRLKVKGGKVDFATFYLHAVLLGVFYLTDKSDLLSSVSFKI
jgi:hypothetical protein